MSNFDYIAEARAIRAALPERLSDWKIRIDEAIASGATGTEILMSLRWEMQELLAKEPSVPADLTQRVKAYILAANRLLS